MTTDFLRVTCQLWVRNSCKDGSHRNCGHLGRHSSAREGTAVKGRHDRHECGSPMYGVSSAHSANSGILGGP